MTLGRKPVATLALALSLALSAAACGNDDEATTAPDFDTFAQTLRRMPYTQLQHLVALRDGQTLYEWHAPDLEPDTPHEIWSCSKTFVALALGYALDEGLLRLDETLPGRDITLLHLLTMMSGQPVDWGLRDRCSNWSEAWLAQPPAAKPGERFAYDSMSTYLLAARIEEATGASLTDYLTPRLFAPLGIEGATWLAGPEGHSCGGWGLQLSARQLATVGQCLLDGGRGIIPAHWIEQMTAAHYPPPGGDYGLGVWHNTSTEGYRMDGKYGQFCVIMPRSRQVVVILQHMEGNHTAEQLGLIPTP